MKNKFFRTITMVLVIALSFTCVAMATDGTTEEDSLWTELPIYSSLEEAQEAADAAVTVQSRATSYGTITPSLVRSGSTTTVKVYLIYSGSYSPSAVEFTSLKVRTLVLGGSVYGSFEPDDGDTYFNASFSGTSAYIGSVTIPTDKSYARVITDDLSVKISSTWHAVTDISGTWSID